MMHRLGRWMVGVTLAAASPQARAQDTAFVGVTVIDPTRGDRPSTTVVTRGGRIVAVGPADSVPLRPGTIRIESPPGSVLFPGLVDAHVHLELSPERWLSAFVARGVTTVFNLRGDSTHLALRDRVARNELVGPRIFTSGPYANLPMIQAPEQADSLARAQKAAGFDMIKIHGNLAERTYRALQVAARREGIVLVGHAPRNLPFDSVLSSSQRMVAHAEEVLYTHLGVSADSLRVDSVTRAMAAAGIWLTPTLTTYAAITEQIGRPGVVDSALQVQRRHLTPEVLQAWQSGMYAGRPAASRPRYVANLALLRSLTRAAARNGVRLLAGTDTPLPLLEPGTSLLRELDELIALGVPIDTALAVATSNASEFASTYLHGPVSFGRISPGASADLLLLEGDPRVNLDVLKRPLGVLLRGRWFDRSALAGLALTGTP